MTEETINYNLTGDRLATRLRDNYLVKFPAYKYLEASTPTREVGENATSILQISSSASGKSRDANGKPDALGLIETPSDGTYLPIFSRELTYYLTEDDRRVAINDGNFSYVDLRQQAGVQIFHKEVNDVFFSGKSGFAGLNNVELDTSNKLDYAPTKKADDPTATAGEIYAQCLRAMNHVFIASGGNHACNTVVLPLSVYSVINTAIFPEDPTMTLLQALVRAGNSLQGSQAGDFPFRLLADNKVGKAGAFYDRSPQVMKFHVPKVIRFSNIPQIHGTIQLFTGTYRVAPLQVLNASAIVRMSGLAT